MGGCGRASASARRSLEWSVRFMSARSTPTTSTQLLGPRANIVRDRLQRMSDAHHARECHDVGSVGTMPVVDERISQV